MTTSGQIKILLKEHLDDLSKDQLGLFQWFLSLRREGFQPIPKHRLENRSREETVDILVEVYGKDDAVVKTAAIFKKMGQHESRLTQAIEDRREQQSHVPVSSTKTENQRDVDSTGTEDLSCSLCFHVFTDPVVLHCGHSFCKSCIHGQWEEEISRKCPLCKQVIPDTQLPISFNLKSLSENCRERKRVEPSGGQRHGSELYQTPSGNMKEKREAFEKVKEFCDSSIEQIKSQSCETEKTIKDKFEELCLFLKKEEETRLAALKEEETRKIRTMQLITEMSRNTLSLTDTVKEMEDLGVEDSFIQTFKVEMERTQKALPDPQQLPQAQINVSKHLEKLQFRVWKKMLSNIKFNPYITSEMQPMYEEWESPVREYICGKDDEEDHAAFFGEVTRSWFNTEEMAFKMCFLDDEDDVPQVMFSSVH